MTAAELAARNFYPHLVREFSGAKMDNDRALAVVSRWRYEDVDRLSLSNLVEYGGIARKVRRPW